MVPLKDDNPTQSTPYITYGLILVNILIFFYQLNQARLGEPSLEGFYRTWAMVPTELTDSFQGAPNPADFGEWLTLITSQFLHAGFLHLGGNMLYLWIFGNNVEDQMGRVRFLLFYLICGVLAALAQWFFSPQSDIPSLGASGAIAGVMGAYILRFPNARILTLLPIFFFITFTRLPAYIFLGFWFILQALNGIASLGAPTMVGEAGGIAYWAHAGGFAFGAILGPLFGLFSKPPGPRRRY